MLTCIINQLDFKAGTNGAAFCIPSGSDNVAKATTKRDKGVLIAPTKGKVVLYSITPLINVIPHTKNNNDSYKLLKGKYPFSNHLDPSIIVINKFARHMQ